MKSQAWWPLTLAPYHKMHLMGALFSTSHSLFSSLFLLSESEYFWEMFSCAPTGQTKQQRLEPSTHLYITQIQDTEWKKRWGRNKLDQDVMLNLLSVSFWNSEGQTFFRQLFGGNSTFKILSFKRSNLSKSVPHPVCAIKIHLNNMGAMLFFQAWLHAWRELQFFF